MSDNTLPTVQPAPLTIHNPRLPWREGLIAAAALLAVIAALRFAYPLADDWSRVFVPAVRQWRDPYSIQNFTNPPWVLFFLPHALLPLAWSNAVNFCITLVVISVVIRHFRGGWKAFVLVFSSPMIVSLAQTNNIDWVSLVAFLLPAQWGLPVLAAKPQVAGGAALVWWKRQNYSLRMLLPTLLIVAVSFLVWGLWPLKFNLPAHADIWNLALFPYSVPIGCYLLYRGWKHDDEILAAVATPFFMPYFGLHSLTVPLVLLACRYPREALYLNLGFWWFLLVEMRRLPLMAM